MRARIRVTHYSIRTEHAYVDWIRRFVLHFGKRHPRELGARHVEAFLSDLAVTRRVAASTQNQAKAALLFLYREVLELELPWLEGITQACTPQRLPLVLTGAEAQALLARMRGTHKLLAGLLYRGVSTFRARPEISRRRPEVGLAVRICVGQSVRRSALGCDPSPRWAMMRGKGQAFM